MNHTLLAMTVGGPLCLSSSLFASGTCPADLDNSGLTNVTDLLMVLDSWGPCTSGCAADVAPLGGNGAVNVNDLLTVLNGWGACDLPPVGGTSLWCEDFELGNYIRWTGDYDDWSSCAFNGFNSSNPHGGDSSHLSQVVCSASESHRGYGGLRFQNDLVLPSYATPSSGGIEAPNGVAVTFWYWLDVPYTFSPTKWLSLMTVTDDCSNTWANVITLNIDDSSMRLKPVHVSNVTYAPNAPSFPLQQWVRTTVYINYYSEQMHVWQNGTKVVSATFSRSGTDMCQWHFGLYASGPNDDVALYEEDLSIVKLTEPWTNMNAEPWFPDLVSTCAMP